MTNVDLVFTHLESGSRGTSGEIANELNISRQAAHAALQVLAAEGRIAFEMVPQCAAGPLFKRWRALQTKAPEAIVAPAGRRYHVHRALLAQSDLARVWMERRT